MTAPATTKPDVTQDEVNRYLDMVSEDGMTHLHGSLPHLIQTYGLDVPTARKMWVTWMRTYRQRHLGADQ